jgi:hypothetical protein
MITKEIIRNYNKQLSSCLIPSKCLDIFCNSIFDPRAHVFDQPIVPKPVSRVIVAKVDGKWLVNGKPYSKTSLSERIFFEEFLLASRWEEQMKINDKSLILQ